MTHFAFARFSARSSALSPAHTSIPTAHQSSPLSAHQSAASPWLAQLAADDVLTLTAVPARRWLRVERGCLWVTAASGAPGPVPREADIWLNEGDSLVLPPGSSWLLQAWPGADLMLVQQAPQRRHQAVGALAPGLAALRGALHGAFVAVARRLGFAGAAPTCTA